MEIQKMKLKDDTLWIKVKYFPWPAIMRIPAKNSNTNQQAWLFSIAINIVFWSHTFYLNSCQSTVYVKSPDKLGNSWRTITVTPMLRVEFHVTMHQKPLPVIVRGRDSSPENADHTLLKIPFRPNMPDSTAIHLDLSSTPIDAVDRKLRAVDSAWDETHKK